MVTVWQNQTTTAVYMMYFYFPTEKMKFTMVSKEVCTFLVMGEA